MVRRLTINEIANRSRDLFNVEYDFSKATYSNKKSVLQLRCPLHNHWFEQPADSHLKGRVGCKYCRIERRRGSQKEGKRIFVGGTSYPSIKAAARAYGVREDKFYSRIQAKWSPEQAAELKPPPTFSHKKYNLSVDGKEFENFAELGRHFGINGPTVRQRVNDGWTLRQAVGLDERKRKMRRKYKDISFRRKRYRSFADLARDYGRDRNKVAGRIRAGWTIEQALDLAPAPRKRSWRREARVIDGRAYPKGSAGRFLLYLVTCKPTGREYVGITTGSLEKRWGEHVSNAMGKQRGAVKLYRAIRKHGPNSFSIELLRDDARDYKELLEQEAREVAGRDCFRHGLNSTAGGENVAGARELEVDGHIFPTLRAAASYFMVDENVLRSRIDALGWTLRQALELDPRPTDWGPKAVTLEGVDYPTIKEACKAYGISNQKVNLRMKRYGWTLEQAFELESIQRPPGVPKKITFQGVEYKSISRLAAKFGLKGGLVSSRLCNGFTIEQALGLKKRKKRGSSGIPIQFRGKNYDSRKALAEHFQVNYKVFHDRLSKGWSIAKALGIDD